jgi:hypothetical protein
LVTHNRTLIIALLFTWVVGACGPQSPKATPASPAWVGGPLPQPAAPISPDNADQVTSLATWKGNGSMYQVGYFLHQRTASDPEETLQSVVSYPGIYLYNAQTLAEKQSLVSYGAQAVAYCYGALLSLQNWNSVRALWRRLECGILPGWAGPGIRVARQRHPALASL